MGWNPAPVSISVPSLSSSQLLRLVTQERNGRAKGIHSMSESMTPDSSREKRRTLLQFLTDHFRDVQTLREHLLQKQIAKVNQENR